MIRTIIIAPFLMSYAIFCESINNHKYWASLYEKTPLMLAAQAGDIVLIKLLIAQGENVNATIDFDQPSMGRPVLRFAIDSGSVETVTLLINAGAQVNDLTVSPLYHPERSHANVRNLPLLSHAIKNHVPIEIIKVLIENGANINQKTVWGDWTPLMVAAYRGYKEAVFALLDAGADKLIANGPDSNRTALDYAIENGNSEIIAILRDY